MIWKSVYLEGRILSADPLELINILYEHAILRVRSARDSLTRRDIAARAGHISKAIAILGELEGSLDYRAGGEIARNLAKLYQYLRERLILANRKQEDEPLAEAEALLTTLGDAWLAITRKEQIGIPSAMPGAVLEPAAGSPLNSWSA
jgi:flagellar protein FliS